MNDPLRKNACIFLVDDEPANLKLLTKMLASRQYEHLVPLQDARQVIDAYRANRPDLILLDINMPHLDGYQVMAQLQALADPLLPPIVILTAQHGRDTLLKALAAGARDFIGKPFDMAELMMRVNNLLDAHLALAQCQRHRGAQLCGVELDPRAAALDDRRQGDLGALIGREALVALGALAPPAHHVALVGLAGLDDLGFDVGTVGAAHGGSVRQRRFADQR